jgi:hypothetical protein
VAAARFHSPDPAPAIELRCRLAQARATGAVFEVAWACAVSGVLGELGDRQWAEAFNATQAAWARAYDRQAVAYSVPLVPELVLDAAPD